MRYEFDGFELDDTTFRLTAGSEVVAVEPQVFDVLVHLLRHRDLRLGIVGTESR
ncbi:MAG: hypothetical protein WBM50_02260 [Acidimicrobiales bacterium]